MHALSWTLRRAMGYVMAKRRIIHPCSHYQLQLLAYEDRLKNAHKRVLMDEQEGDEKDFTKVIRFSPAKSDATKTVDGESATCFLS
jgi:hypothetical protein